MFISAERKIKTYINFPRPKISTYDRVNLTRTASCRSAVKGHLDCNQTKKQAGSYLFTHIFVFFSLFWVISPRLPNRIFSIGRTRFQYRRGDFGALTPPVFRASHDDRIGLIPPATKTYGKKIKIIFGKNRSSHYNHACAECTH